MSTIKRALISVSDKSGVVELAKGLAAMGVELCSTGGTARMIREAGLEVRDISDVTGHPEILDGRVKTLHPAVHGGLLARRRLDSDMSQLDELGIGPIDLVAVNLYPFEQTVADADIAPLDALEEIDIGGVTLIRAAAKNHPDVTLVCEPADYGTVLEEMQANDGAVTDATRLRLAWKGFAQTANYDLAISTWFATRLATETGTAPAGFPATIALGGRKLADLRYGENPHQSGALYADAKPGGPTGWAAAEQLSGKQMGYCNFWDATGGSAG
jgi:phosphoribosylaminoimidazolecarboxamide formyltransferase/IMP cyclohydrolase